MTSETDEQFVKRMAFYDYTSQHREDDIDRLFALARRGAAVAHTDDKRAHSPFANSENATKGEQRTICEACGNSNLAHDRAAWTNDGTSYCPSCLPPPTAGETNE